MLGSTWRRPRGPTGAGLVEEAGHFLPLLAFGGMLVGGWGAGREESNMMVRRDGMKRPGCSDI